MIIFDRVLGGCYPTPSAGSEARPDDAASRRAPGGRPCDSLRGRREMHDMLHERQHERYAGLLHLPHSALYSRFQIFRHFAIPFSFFAATFTMLQLRRDALQRAR